MKQFPQARDLKAGQWILRRNGAYLIDSVQIKGGIVYVGTVHGVLAMPVHEQVHLGGMPCYGKEER
jgi:hypothetical protein